MQGFLLRLRVDALIAAGLLFIAPFSLRGAEASFAGRTLQEALLELQSRGLRIVFTSNVVRPDLTVATEPRSREPLGILEELLAPHGLTTRQGPNEALIVVAGEREGAEPELGRAEGSVKVRGGGVPLPGATVRIVESGRETLSDGEGNFLFPALPPGRWTLEASLEGFVSERQRAVEVGPDGLVKVDFEMAPTPIIEEELVVTPSRVSLLADPTGNALALSRDELLALPHLGGDFFRALTLLPGTLGNDVSAEFHVRGARRDETQILIDGQELYDAFHLKERDNAISVVESNTLGRADLTTGGFSAEYGDRMSGVLDMTTVTPTGGARGRFGLSFLDAHLGGGGRFAADRGSWLASVRRGATDLVGRLLGDEDPRYWDTFGKLEWRLGEGDSVRINLLGAGDKLDFEERIEEDFKRIETEYESSYLWLTHRRLAGPRLFFDTALSLASIERDRRALEDEEDATFQVLDLRDVEVRALRQDWSLAASPGNRLSWGWRLREYDSVYDYQGAHAFDHPLAAIRHDGEEGFFSFQGRFEESQESAYLTDRLELAEDLTMELGLRYDRHTQTDESHLTPRFNLARGLGERGVLRLAWGRFHQSQRPYELQVEDGESRFHPVERGEHRVLGFERSFPTAVGGTPLSARIELYERRVRNPRTRYENLFEPINSFPELEPDRVRVDAARARARGLEIFVRGALSRRLSGWLNYSWSRTEDRVDGAWRRRIFDQTHSLNLDLDYRLNDAWRLNLAWRFHTGWPTTPIDTRPETDEDGEIVFVPELGEINGDRLPTYHRLDLRVSRGWRLDSLAVDLFLDVQNLYDRRNVGGYDLEIDDENGSVVAVGETWAPFLASAGFSLEF